MRLILLTSQIGLEDINTDEFFSGSIRKKSHKKYTAADILKILYPIVHLISSDDVGH
jgi:hypothetical protein